MIQNLIDEILGKKTSTPNKFTVAMGALVKKARNEIGLSQAELAKSIYIRQASISEIENGKREVSSSELVYLSIALNKPIIYFFPKRYAREIDQDKLSPLFQELLLQAKRLSNADLKRLIAQTRALGDME